MYNVADSSGRKQADAQIATMPCRVHGIIVDPPSTGIVTLTVYDSEDSNTSGKRVLLYFEQLAGIGSVPVNHPAPIVANRGIYCTFSGVDIANAGYIVYYSLS